MKVLSEEISEPSVCVVFALLFSFFFFNMLCLFTVQVIYASLRYTFKVSSKRMHCKFDIQTLFTLSENDYMSSML